MLGRDDGRQAAGGGGARGRDEEDDDENAKHRSQDQRRGIGLLEAD